MKIATLLAGVAAVALTASAASADTINRGQFGGNGPLAVNVQGGTFLGDIAADGDGFTAERLAVNHDGQFPAVTISYNLRPGISLSQGVGAVEAAARPLLPDTVTAESQGTAQAFQSSLKGMGWLLSAAGDVFNSTRVLCCVLVLVVLIIALDAVVHLLEWRLLRWRG